MKAPSVSRGTCHVIRDSYGPDLREGDLLVNIYGTIILRVSLIRELADGTREVTSEPVRESYGGHAIELSVFSRLTSTSVFVRTASEGEPDGSSASSRTYGTSSERAYRLRPLGPAGPPADHCGRNRPTVAGSMIAQASRQLRAQASKSLRAQATDQLRVHTSACTEPARESHRFLTRKFGNLSGRRRPARPPRRTSAAHHVGSMSAALPEQRGSQILRTEIRNLAPAGAGSAAGRQRTENRSNTLFTAGRVNVTVQIFTERDRSYT